VAGLYGGPEGSWVGEVDELAGRDADDVVALAGDAVLERRAEELGRRVEAQRHLGSKRQHWTEQRHERSEHVDQPQHLHTHTHTHTHTPLQ